MDRAPARASCLAPAVVVAFALALSAASSAAQSRPAAKRADSARIRIALVGQALIRDDICTTAPASAEQARGYLQGTDVAFTNLETAIASPGQPLTLRSPGAGYSSPVVIDCLKSMGFNLLSLANNHAFDLKAAGSAAAIDEVRTRGIGFAGTGADDAAAAAPGYLDTPKGRVALVAMATGASQLVPETWAAPNRAGVNYLERLPDGRLNPEHKKRILDAVRAAARQSGLVIAYYHNHDWGNDSGSGLPPDRERRISRFTTQPSAVEWAHELIDAGASLYVSHGDPSLHGVEVYKGRLILYGLGNFIFESGGGQDRYGPLAYMSVVVTAEYVNGRVTGAQFRPLVLSLTATGAAPRGTPYLAEAAEADVILQRLTAQSRRHGVTLRIDDASKTAVVRLP